MPTGCLAVGFRFLGHFRAGLPCFWAHIYANMFVFVCICMKALICSFQTVYISCYSVLKWINCAFLTCFPHFVTVCHSMSRTISSEHHAQCGNIEPAQVLQASASNTSQIKFGKNTYGGFWGQRTQIWCQNCMIRLREVSIKVFSSSLCLYHINFNA